jgi:pseudouridine kinase
MNDDFSPNPEGPVLVIGAAGVDLIGNVKGELKNSTSNPAHIRSSYGGVGRNLAENLARLGHPVQLITAVGDDLTGQQMLDNLAQAGVDVSHAFHSALHPTGTYLAVIRTGGDLQFALDDMRAMSELTPDYFDARTDLFSECSAVFVDGNLSRESLRRIVLHSKRAGVPLCVNPTSTALASRFIPYLKNIRLLIGNTHEAAILTSSSSSVAHRREALQAAKNLVIEGVGFVVITLAEAGVCYATSEINGHVPALRTTIVDPTGGGDAMAAAILFALLNDIPVDDAVRLGTSAASLTLGHSGAVVPDLSLERLYDHLVV